MLNKDYLVFALRDSVNKCPRAIHSQASTKAAAVLVIIHFSQASPYILLTKRNSVVKYHKGEISFPGGAFIEQDRSLCATAIRETREEIGVRIEEKDILGCLNSVRTLTSNFSIFPFVTIQETNPLPQIVSGEVEDIIDAPLFDLLHTIKSDFEHRQMSKNKLYEFTCDSHVIWGATATILKQLRDILYYGVRSD